MYEILQFSWSNTDEHILHMKVTKVEAEYVVYKYKKVQTLEFP